MYLLLKADYNTNSIQFSYVQYISDLKESDVLSACVPPEILIPLVVKFCSTAVSHQDISSFAHLPHSLD